MKVTVSFGRTLIVVPCKDGQLTVGDFTQQAAQRYLKIKEKEAGGWVKVRHLEYTDGGILDPDDVLADLVEDKDKLIAVYDEQESYLQTDSTNGGLMERLSPDPFENEMTTQNSAYHSAGGEIVVTPSALRLGTPLLVRRSSDPALGPPAAFHPGTSHPSDQSPKLSVTSSSRQGSAEDGEMDSIWQPEYLASHKITHTNRSLTRTVNIAGEGGPLGIHVVPFYSSLSGRILGLHVRGIEEHSRSRRDGLFHENESIVKINSVDLTDRTFTQAQDLFRQAMKYENVQVEVVPPENRELYEKCVIAPLVSYGDEGVPKTKVPPPIHVKPSVTFEDLSGPNSLETGGMPPLPSSRSAELALMGKKLASPSLSPLGFGSKKNARRLRIDLKKGPDGLGFTVVTKDSSVHGPGPIFVKNILPKGAAIRDGNLQSGDRILEVNGRDITGKTQEQLVAMLRSTKQGETVSMVVARQDEAFLPRELKGEPEVLVPSVESKAQLTFEIPLNDTGSAGLGISLKGNKSRDTGADLGIFIKSIIHGGAAFKDGRLRVNDKLIAVNGESLLGKSNHDAMETLRRSMSMEGNIRGMIQLVILRKLDKHTDGHYKDHAEFGVFAKPAFDGSYTFSPVPKPNITVYENVPHERPNGTELLMAREDIAENDVTPPLPPHPTEEMLNEHHQYSPGVDSAAYLTDQHKSLGSSRAAKQTESIKMKASKSMDLVEDESNISSLAGHKSESPSKDFGPTLGLKKSSSLESLQTAVAEVNKNELPFHRPRPHMVRGRGCNESFRTAIDKSYDGPDEQDDDALSDVSSPSGRDTPSSESATQGNPEPEDTEKKKKDKKKKDKDKKKEKGKPNVKEKKKKEETEEQEKKAKKKGFGAMLRFGKKKEDKSGKAEQKGNLKNATIKEEELEKMKEERERIVAKHQELREKQARGLMDHFVAPPGPIPDMVDDDMDPSYARVNHFREAPVPLNVYRSSSPPGTLGYLRDVQMTPVEREHMEGMYAKINKPHHPQAPTESIHPSTGNADRIQQLRKEYHQARREGFHLYEEEEDRGRPSEYEQHWIPGKGPEGSSHGVRFDGMERQYASLPRRGPQEPPEYLAGPRGYKERELPYYPGIQPVVHTSKGTYPRPPDVKVPDYRYPQYYPPPQAKGPLRQDVPPSPPQPHRAPVYSEVGRVPRPQGASPDQYQYRSQDPRHKNPMTAAV